MHCGIICTIICLDVCHVRQFMQNKLVCRSTTCKFQKHIPTHLRWSQGVVTIKGSDWIRTGLCPPVGLEYQSPYQLGRLLHEYEVCRGNRGSAIQWERVRKFQPYPVKTFLESNLRLFTQIMVTWKPWRSPQHHLNIQHFSGDQPHCPKSRTLCNFKHVRDDIIISQCYFNLIFFRNGGRGLRLIQDRIT